MACGGYLPPFRMYLIMACRTAIHGAPVRSGSIAKRSHTSQNDVCATRGLTGNISKWLDDASLVTFNMTLP
jgi:hypothetical protein